MQNNWQANFFHGIALDFWRRAISPEQTRAEVDFLEKALQPVPNAQLLDVPCGNGRHALELAKRGYSLTGIDSSEEFVIEAQAASSAAKFMLGDMCSLPALVPAQSFDGVYCAGNSFAYLDSKAARKFLGDVAAVLKSGGRFVMDTGMAAEAILPTLGAGRTHRIGDMMVVSENRYHPAESRLDIDYTFIRDGRMDTRPSVSYCFTTGEICRMQAEAGLEVVELRDWYSERPFQLGARGLVVISRKE
jgi:SAM-dependent methyltransferase